MRVVFIGEASSVEIPLSHINAIKNTGVELAFVGKTGSTSASFTVDDPELLEAYARRSIQAFHRQVDVGFEGVSRQIPQDVKTAVYQRDGGRCIQCGATDYLEYDHIIPFSLGGASTVNNVQLLCRRCNLKKSDSI